jgi:phosphatidylserine/phosphatidylglycerophosphate/cardiolipin synthase-like enzyme
MGTKGIRSALFVLFVVTFPLPTSAQVTHCDSSAENCRNELVRLIDSETIGIDGAQWIHRDSTIISALIRAHRRGVLVRMLVDLNTENAHEGVTEHVNTMRDAGVPVQRKASGGGILHWKFYLFHGQGVVKYGAANSTPGDLIPVVPYENYRNETNIFDARPSIVQSFIRKFDDAWVSPNFVNYGNVPSTLKVRAYPTFPIDTERLVFVPGGGLKSRLLDLINRETQMIDLSILRLGDQQITEALINAFRRGVELRINSEQTEYRDTLRYVHAYALDQLYAAGIRPRWRAHSGQNHEKTMVFHGLGVLWTGSSNLVASSLNANMEHNLFSTDPEEVAWYTRRLARRWFNSQFVDGVQMIESKPFTPGAPGAATSLSPANGFVGTPTQLVFNGGFYGITADVYFGTTPSPPLYLSGIPLGVNTKRPVALPPLGSGTTYYWKVITRTHANRTSSTATLSFTTPGAPAPPPPSSSTDVVLWASRATKLAGAWRVEPDASAAGGARARHPDAGAARVAAPLASPTNYFELTFNADANVSYHLWLRGRADRDSWANDSVFVQFSNVPAFAIGTTNAMTVTLEDCTNCGVSGWGWQDNAANAFASPFMFTTSGPQTIRIQTREDGLAIDQVVLSPSRYFTTSPGKLKNDTTILTPSSGQ